MFFFISHRLHWYIDLILTLAIYNLKSEVRLLYLSYLWWIIEPFLYMAVFYYVFEIFLGRGGENFVSFLLIGTISFIWLSKTITYASNSLVNAQSIMNHVSINSIIFPLISVVQVLIKQLPVFIILIIFLYTQGIHTSFHWLHLIPVFILHLLFIVALSFISAILIASIRDLGMLVAPGLMFLMFVSGVFFNYKDINVAYHDIFLNNPFAFIIASYRDVILYTQDLDYFRILIFYLIFAVMIILEVMIFKRYNARLIELMSR